MDVEIAVRVLYMLGEAMSVRLQALDDFNNFILPCVFYNNILIVVISLYF